MHPLILLALVLVVAAPAAAQAVASKPPGFDMGALVTYAVMLLWSAVGGLVSFSQKVRIGKARWLNITELLGEMVISGFAGLTTGLLLQSIDAPLPLIFAAVGLAGHAGGRGMFWLETVGQRKVEQVLGLTPTAPPVADAPVPPDSAAK